MFDFASELEGLKLLKAELKIKRQKQPSRGVLKETRSSFKK